MYAYRYIARFLYLLRHVKLNSKLPIIVHRENIRKTKRTCVENLLKKI